MAQTPVLLWLWCMPVAVALIRPLAWEPPYVVGVALKKAKKKKEGGRKEGKRWKRSELILSATELLFIRGRGKAE